MNGGCIDVRMRILSFGGDDGRGSLQVKLQMADSEDLPFLSMHVFRMSMA